MRKVLRSGELEGWRSFIYFLSFIFSSILYIALIVAIINHLGRNDTIRDFWLDFQILGRLILILFVFPFIIAPFAYPYLETISILYYIISGEVIKDYLIWRKVFNGTDKKENEKTSQRTYNQVNRYLTEVEAARCKIEDFFRYKRSHGFKDFDSVLILYEQMKEKYEGLNNGSKFILEGLYNEFIYTRQSLEEIEGAAYGIGMFQTIPQEDGCRALIRALENYHEDNIVQLMDPDSKVALENIVGKNGYVDVRDDPISQEMYQLWSNQDTSHGLNMIAQIPKMSLLSSYSEIEGSVNNFDFGFLIDVMAKCMKTKRDDSYA